MLEQLRLVVATECDTATLNHDQLSRNLALRKFLPRDGSIELAKIAFSGSRHNETNVGAIEFSGTVSLYGLHEHQLVDGRYTL